MKCFDSLVINMNENKRQKELQDIKEREDKLKELHQKLIDRKENEIQQSRSSQSLSKNRPEIIIVPDPHLLKQIQQLKNDARRKMKEKQLCEYRLARANSRKSILAWRHHSIFTAWNTWRNKIRNDKRFRRIIARHM